MKEQHKAEDAVSPVIGVMLMLVVTIIIAAVVSGFAGGLAEGAEAAPQASIAVSTGTISDGNFDIKFEHKGGDPIRTKDCEFITFLTLPNGTVIKHVQTPTSPLARGNQGPSGVYFYSRGPHLTDPQKYAYPCAPQADVTLPSDWVLKGFEGSGEENHAWFGQAVWLPGDVARTYHDGFTANFVGLIEDPYPGDDAGYEAATATLKDCVKKNCKLEIKLLHVPSGKYILDKTITLQG